MIKFLLKLAVAALIAHAVWKVGAEYANYYSFRDEVRNEAVYRNLNEDDLRQRILELAADRDLPLGEGNLSVSRNERHVVIEGAYTKPITVLPGYDYPFSFDWTIDALVVGPPPPTRSTK